MLPKNSFEYALVSYYNLQSQHASQNQRMTCISRGTFSLKSGKGPTTSFLFFSGSWETFPFCPPHRTLDLLMASAHLPTSAGFLLTLLCLSQKSKGLPCIGKIPMCREMRKMSCLEATQRAWQLTLLVCEALSLATDLGRFSVWLVHSGHFYSY